MHAVRQKCRPKHQVLVLRCYPHFQKNVQEVKANSSELSYLLYYTTTRRSKLQKVCDFLEQKAVNDIYKKRIGNLQVALQIFNSLIDRLPQELPIFSANILCVLQAILCSKELVMVDESLPIFGEFCTRIDAAALVADQKVLGSFQDLVRRYLELASIELPSSWKPGTGPPDSLRQRSIGLSALEHITKMQLAWDNGFQMTVMIDVLLRGLRHLDGKELKNLQHSARGTDKQKAPGNQRCNTEYQSRNTLADSVMATGNLDPFAEEELAISAMIGLRQIFANTSRGQTRLGTTAILKAMTTDSSTQFRREFDEKFIARAVAMFEMIAEWTSVQDRFVILVTIMETLIRSPIEEVNMGLQLFLVNLIASLLKSDINMIGLSVMDVLLGLVHHILLILQLGGRHSSIAPHHQQNDAIDLFKDTGSLFVMPDSIKNDNSHKSDCSASSTRRQVLAQLQECIGELGTHIYYSDQISDIITAILLRLKPPAASNVHSATAAIEHPQAAAQAIVDSVSLQEDPSSDDFFSFATARCTALEAIGKVLRRSNRRRSSISGGSASGRNRVNISIWDDTQWLLRDQDSRVRRAYVDALLTWLRHETVSTDSRICEGDMSTSRSVAFDQSSKDTHNITSTSRRAFSNASRTSRASSLRAKASRTDFLRLIHLAIYDNVTDPNLGSEDAMLMHLLLHNLVARLGVNAIKTGLPMVLRIQKDIQVNNQLTLRTIYMGNLVLGYLCSIVDAFNLRASASGTAVYNLLDQRKKHNIWTESIQIPPIPLERLAKTNTRLNDENCSITMPSTYLEPFHLKDVLVRDIADAYAYMVALPPNSPPTSPGRTLKSPILTINAVNGPSDTDHDSGLPREICDEMLSPWSKEAAIAYIERETDGTLSTRGSRRIRQATVDRGDRPAEAYSPSSVGKPDPLHEVTGDAGDQRIIISRLSREFRNSAQYSGHLTPTSSASRQIKSFGISDLKRTLTAAKMASSATSRSSDNMMPCEYFQTRNKASQEGSATVSNRRQNDLSLHIPELESSFESESIGHSEAGNLALKSNDRPKENASSLETPASKPAPSLITASLTPSNSSPSHLISSPPAEQAAFTEIAKPHHARELGYGGTTKSNRSVSLHSRNPSTNPSTPRSPHHPNHHSQVVPPNLHHQNHSLARSRPHSDSEQSAGGVVSSPRSGRRMSTSSSAAGEDPDLNAAALRGDILSKRLSVDLGYGVPEFVPPVPPIPKSVVIPSSAVHSDARMARRPGVESSGVASIRAQNSQTNTGHVNSQRDKDVPENLEALPPSLIKPQHVNGTSKTSQSQLLSSNYGTDTLENVSIARIAPSRELKRNPGNTIDIEALLESIDPTDCSETLLSEDSMNDDPSNLPKDRRIHHPNAQETQSNNNRRHLSSPSLRSSDFKGRHGRPPF